jgi:bifunctional DNA-binding transcriptional regulator/antitoxin component of YhaV-PrlF toxin-antitoxin module
VADIATLSAKFHITIRKPVREARDWKPGQTFALVPTGSGVALVPVPEIGDLAGIAAGATAEDDRDRDDRYWCASSLPRRGSNG